MLERQKEQMGFIPNYQESTQSWAELLTDLKLHGLEESHLLEIGDDALCFQSALGKYFPTTHQQRF